MCVRACVCACVRVCVCVCVCARAVAHAFPATGEPPLFLGSSALFAIRNAIGAARKDEGLDNWLPVHAPLTAERIRMACTDGFTKSVLDGQTDFFAKGSF